MSTTPAMTELAYARTDPVCRRRSDAAPPPTIEAVPLTAPSITLLNLLYAWATS